MTITAERPTEAPPIDLTNDDAAVLERAAERVLKGWCQGTGARTYSGVACRYYDPEAAWFCMQGAVYKEAPTGHAIRPMIAVQIELRARGWEGSAWSWNDERGRKPAEVAELLLSAADRC